MTIPIKLLNDLPGLEGTPLEPKLKLENLDNLNIEKVTVDEKTYRWEMNCKYLIIKCRGRYGNRKIK